jgi:hypothetical protein
MGDQVLVAPPGVQNQQYGPVERMPTPPRQANSLIVGGPAYFTPEGYQAPVQPQEAFMPTRREYDPIRDQFNRQSQSPMGQQYQEQYQATQAPIRAAEAAKRAEEQAAQDARFQEQMDRIAELEGQLATPAGPAPVVEPVVPPGAYPPYIPGVTPFPRIPGLGDLDFSGLPGMGDIDMDRIIQEYQDRIDAGEPEPFDSFLPTPPPPPPEPNGFFPDIDPRDYQDMGFEDMDFTNLGNMDFSNIPKYKIPAPTMPAPPPAPAPAYIPPAPVQQAPVLPMGLNPPLNMSFNAAKSGSAPVVQAPVEPIYTPPPRFEMKDIMDNYDYGNPRNMRGFDPRR